MPDPRLSALATPCLLVDEAKTLDQQARGMMFRESMEPDTGMIFEFESSIDYVVSLLKNI